MEMRSADFFSNHWNIQYRHHAYEKGVILQAVPKEKPFLGLFFNLKSDTNYKMRNGLAGTIRKNQYNLFYTPQGECDVIYQDKHSSFYTAFDLEYLQTLAASAPVLDEFIQRIDGDTPEQLWNEHQPMTREIHNCINVIAAGNIQGEAQRAYQRAKLFELVLISLSPEYAPENVTANSLDVKADDHDLEKVRNAHDYILKNLKFPLNVFMLSDKVGMPVRKLENLFKQIYGTTVYDFLINERLKMAVELLTNTTMTLSEIAVNLGYTRLNTFTKLFSRKFGQPPRALRKDELRKLKGE